MPSTRPYVAALVLTLVVSVGLLVAFDAAHRTSRATTQAQAETQAKPAWEYAVLHHDAGGYIFSRAGTSVHRRNLADLYAALRPAAEDQERPRIYSDALLLDLLGGDGWELASHSRGGAHGPEVWTFKRRR